MYCTGCSYSKVDHFYCFVGYSIQSTWTLVHSGVLLQPRMILQNLLAIFMSSCVWLHLLLSPRRRNGESPSLEELHMHLLGIRLRGQWVPKVSLSFLRVYNIIMKSYGSSQISERFDDALCQVACFQRFRRVSIRTFPRIGAMRRNALS